MQIFRMKYMLTILVLLFFTACKEEPEEGNEYKQTERIRNLTAHSWMVSRLEHETSGDVSSQYTDFTLTFDDNAESEEWDGTYNAQNGGLIFPASNGKWRFVENTEYYTLEREDGVIMQIEELTDNSLILEVEVPSTSATSQNMQSSQQSEQSGVDTIGISGERQDDETEPVPEEGAVSDEDFDYQTDYQSRTMATSGTFVITFIVKE